MKRDDLDTRMRRFEAADGATALPNVYLVARLDGRGFTRLTRTTHPFEAPFDERFRDLMLSATRALFDAGPRFLFGYTQSDEISLLLGRDEAPFDRRLSKLNSVLASTASAAFSIGLGAAVSFDCRVLPLPTDDDVVDYFRWRQEDAARNALSGWAYWTLRKEGRTQREATRQLEGLKTSEKNELLFQRGINFNAVPTWQRRGVGLYWKRVAAPGVDPRSGQAVPTTRRRLVVDLELPMKSEFLELVRAHLAS